MKYVALLFLCLLVGCQEKEEASPSLESMAQTETEEWEFDTKDLAGHDPEFSQEILIQDPPETPITEPSALR